MPFPNPFVLRNWDIREQQPQTPLGTDQSFKIIFRGKRPTSPQGQVCGNADLWANGLSFADWKAGLYSCNCPAENCGIWSELCQTILPDTFKVAGDFGFFGQAFTGVATWSSFGGLNTWTVPTVNFICGGVPFAIDISLVENVGQGQWELVVNGGVVFIDTFVCTYPQHFTQDSQELMTCPPVGGDPVHVTVTFTAP